MNNEIQIQKYRDAIETEYNILSANIIVAAYYTCAQNDKDEMAL